MKAALIAVFLLGCYLGVSTCDYNAKAAASQERQRPQGRATASPEEARIWSQRCERQGKQVIASQADGGNWKLRCVNANLKV